MDLLDIQRDKAKQWGEAMRRVQNLRELLAKEAEADPDAPYWPSQALDGMPHGNTRESRTERLAISEIRRANVNAYFNKLSQEKLRDIEEGWILWNSAIDRLDEECREVLTQRYVRQYSPQTIADGLNLSKSAVYDRERRGLMEVWRMMV